jgi:hypothetical protein
MLLVEGSNRKERGDHMQERAAIGFEKITAG